MRAIYILLIFLLVAIASASVVMRCVKPQPTASPKIKAVQPTKPAKPTVAVEPIAATRPTPATNPVPVAVKTPVQPIEERGDAMLFESDALENTPFDKAVTQPFD